MARKFKLCKMVSTASREGRKHIRHLHKLQGYKGHVKLPGQRRLHIINKGKRHAARQDQTTRRKIIYALNKKHRRRSLAYMKKHKTRHAGRFEDKTKFSSNRRRLLYPKRGLHKHHPLRQFYGDKIKKEIM